jgi:hypothetical protein
MIAAEDLHAGRTEGNGLRSFHRGQISVDHRSKVERTNSLRLEIEQAHIISRDPT